MPGTELKRSRNTAAVWLAAACAAIGLIGLLFEISFVVGRRGFSFAAGGEAQIIGGFWLLVSAAFLATRLPNMAMRRHILTVIAVLLFGGILGIFGYFVYVLR